MTDKISIEDKHGRPQDANNPLRFGDPIKGELEQQPGELLADKEVTRRADEQRAIAQADEPADYPGDSGAQAAAKAQATEAEAAEQREMLTATPDKGPGEEPLTGDALKQRAKELDVEGRSEMSADDLRKAVADAEQQRTS